GATLQMSLRVGRLQIPEGIAQLRGRIVIALLSLTLRRAHVAREACQLVRETLTIIDERLHVVGVLRIAQAAAAAQFAHPAALLALLIGEPAGLAAQGIQLVRDVLLLHTGEQVHRFPKLVGGAAGSHAVVLVHRATHLVLGLPQAVQRLARARGRGVSAGVATLSIARPLAPLLASGRALPAAARLAALLAAL